VNVNRSAFESSTSGPTVAAGPDWVFANEPFERRRRVVGHNRVQQFAVKPEDKRPIGSAQAYGAFSNGFEDGLKIERRAADHFEYVCRRRLLLERFAQFIE
jgi:hypothetical protein